MDRRQFLVALLGGAIGMKQAGRIWAARAAGDPAGRPPNIIVILSDDLGYADSGCYGGDVATPGIDRLAREGVLMTDGYASAPVCSASRAGLMTGRYQQRFGYYYYRNASEIHGLPLEEVTIADLLRDAGYVTGIVGKWDLGQRRKFRPLERGFDEFYGFLVGFHDYFDLQSKQPIFRGNAPIADTGYLTQNFTKEALSFIERHRDRPFFLYLAYNAPHTPYQAPEEYLRRFTRAQGTRNKYLAMVACMDDGIAEVLDKLDELGIGRNTLVFFLSDNGGAAPPIRGRTGGVADNGVLRGRKRQLWEGGIRVPFIVRWPAMLPAGRTCCVPCISLDILPTALAAAGGELPEGRAIDGENMLPLLRGECGDLLHDTLFWTTHEYETWAVRRRDWKLVHMDGNVTLCDLPTDVGEQRNLASEKPELVKELTDAYRAWQAEMADATPGELRHGKRLPALEGGSADRSP